MSTEQEPVVICDLCGGECSENLQPVKLVFGGYSKLVSLPKNVCSVCGVISDKETTEFVRLWGIEYDIFAKMVAKYEEDKVTFEKLFMEKWKIYGGLSSSYDSLGSKVSLREVVEFLKADGVLDHLKCAMDKPNNTCEGIGG